jgi:TPR repeat protein
LCGCDRIHFENQAPFVQVSAGACPRPDAPTGHQPQFNQQQREIRLLRELAFRGDFFAQLDLADRYDARRDADKNLDDPIEAAVWYALALANPGGYESVAPRRAYLDSDRAMVAQEGGGSLYDDCRAFERTQASGILSQLWSRMSSGEQDEVRKRVVYVLSTQGAAGFRVLARVSQTDTGPYGEPRRSEPPRRRESWWRRLHLPGFGSRPQSEQQPSGLYAIELFPRNDVDAYLYDYLAAESGDVAAYVLLKDFESASPDRAGYADFVEAKANRWVQPFEFYPPDAPASGVPHSDESSYNDEAGQIALSRIGELPFVHVLDALRYLHVINCPAMVFDGRRYGAGLYALKPSEVQAFQAMLGREQTGILTPLDRVRAIQYAAVNGSTHAQLVLAVMYAEGIGVRADYARAFYWFQEADRGGSPEAKFAIANYFSLGVVGVADQNKAKAVVLRLDSAMAGFQPQADHIQAVLAQVTRKLRF